MNIIVFLFGMLIAATVIHSTIKTLVTIVTARPFGYELNALSIFGYVFIKDSMTGKFKGRMNQFTPTVSCITVYDNKKPVSDDCFESDQKRVWLNAVVNSIICTIIAAIIIYTYILSKLDGENGFIQFFSLSVGIGLLFQSVISLIIAKAVIDKVNYGLGGLVEKYRRMMLNGVPFEMFDMEPLESLDYSSNTFAEELFYYQYYCYYLISNGRIEEARDTTEKMRAILDSKEVNLHLVFFFSWLLFFYSRFELNAELADKYFYATRNLLEHDNDANSKRVLAYYYFGIRQDYDCARRYVDEGLARVDLFSRGSERELERQMLYWLDDCLIKKGK